MATYKLEAPKTEQEIENQPQYKVRATFSGHNDSITTMAFSQEGNSLASGSKGTMVNIWDVKNRKLDKSLIGHTDGINKVCWIYDSSILASASNDKTIRLWDRHRGRTLRTIKHSYPVVDFDCNRLSTLLLSAGDKKELNLWNIDYAQILKYIVVDCPVTTVKFNHDGTQFALSSSDGLIRLADVGSVNLITMLSAPRRLAFAYFSPCDKYLLSASLGENALRLWDLRKRSCVKIFVGHPCQEMTNFARFSYDNKLILCSSKQNSIYMCDYQKAKSYQPIKTYGEAVTTIAYSQNQHMFASDGFNQRQINLWERVN